MKILFITLKLTILTFALTACGGGGGGSNTTSTQASTQNSANTSTASSTAISSSAGLSSAQQSSIAGETATIKVTTNEYGSANKNQFVTEKGQSTEIELTPLFGYAISSIEGCNGELINNTYRIQTVSADCQVTVYFAQTLDFELELAVNAESSAIKYIAQLSGNRVLTVSQTENGIRVLHLKSTQDASVSVSWVFDQSDTLTHLFWRIDNNTSNALIFTKEGVATNVSYRSPLGTSWNLGAIDLNSLSSTTKITANQPAKLKLAVFNLDELIEGHREWIARVMLNHAGGIAFNFEPLLDWMENSSVKFIMRDGINALNEKISPLIESFKTKTEDTLISTENLIKLQKSTAPNIQITTDDLDEMPELKPETAQAIQNLSDDIRAKVDAVKPSYTDLGASNQLLNTDGTNIQQFGVPGVEGSTGANGGKASSSSIQSSTASSKSNSASSKSSTQLSSIKSSTSSKSNSSHPSQLASITLLCNRNIPSLSRKVPTHDVFFHYYTSVKHNAPSEYWTARTTEIKLDRIDNETLAGKIDLGTFIADQSELSQEPKFSSADQIFTSPNWSNKIWASGIQRNANKGEWLALSCQSELHESPFNVRNINDLIDITIDCYCDIYSG